MAAYVVAQVHGVNDPAGFAEYRSRVTATIEAHGGKFLVRDGATQVLEGDWRPVLVILEFGGAEQAKAWYDSIAYQRLLALRQHSAIMELILVEGV
jgi:uncharacterized protein (DUF1330 family)